MPSFPSNLSLFIEVKAFKSSHSVIASSHNFQNLCFHWRGMFLSSPLSLLPASSFHCCGFWDVDICTWFAGVTIAHACILLFSLIRSRFIHNVILLFITTSMIIHGLVQLWVGIVSSVSCPAILESSSCPHSSSLMVWNASSYSYSTPVVSNVSFFLIVLPWFEIPLLILEHFKGWFLTEPFLIRIRISWNSESELLLLSTSDWKDDSSLELEVEA